MSGECDKCGEHALECNCETIASDTMKFIMTQIPTLMGKEFVNEMINILTLCLSETVKAGYCKGHYTSALVEINHLIKQDLEL